MDKLIEQTPHFHLVKKDETINLRSIFDFKGGAEELFPFLYACEKLNCTVHFENEDITVPPKSESFLNVRLSLYAMISVNPKMAEDYARYVFNYMGEGDRTPTVVQKEVPQ